MVVPRKTLALRVYNAGRVIGRTPKRTKVSLLKDETPGKEDDSTIYYFADENLVEINPIDDK
jgi:hypothetical protein